MNGGLYRSKHAAPDGRPPMQEGVTVVSVDGPAPGEERAPSEDGSTTGQSAIMAVGSLVSRIIGFVRNALIGMALGGAVGNAYTSAQFLPGQIYELLLGGVLSSVLIPLLVRRRKSDADGGEEFTRKLLSFAVVMLGVATVLVVAAASLITAIQASGDAGNHYRDLVTNFAYLILPIIFFTGVSALIGAVLNVRGHFAAPMWAPILNNIVVIAVCGVFLLVFGAEKELTPENISPAQIALMGGGTLLGMVVQTVGLLPALRKVGFRWAWRWDPRSLGLREIGNLAGWMLCYVAANQVAVFAVVRILNDSGDDSPGALAFNNVFLLMMMAHGIIGVSVMTALLPKMSAAAAEGRYAEISEDLSRGIKLVTAALAPIVVVYAVLSDPIAVFLFQGGRITNADALAMGTVLTVAAFAVVPLSISFLCTNAFYALQGNKTVALINLPVVAVRIGAYFAFAAILDEALTAAGMTAANGISYLLSALISLSVLRRRIGRLNLGSVFAALCKVTVAAGVAAGVALLVVRLLPGSGAPDGRIEAITQLAVGGVVILTVYLSVALLLRVAEVSQVVAMVRRKISR
ncbi:murein biosynthesis integral membrane protein MurJ [Actinoplanes sp. NEAU-A12]|uniref:Murein biosynthesis integral membrane protein MurJ n=1 Tax=Actinoplanes sandaracinus TaxID=3045177 RepID=A0ABT6WHB6_9ACTN|nr:murein biosynthesis integral membrane protein MurJ [Actinoplanes sandaracinus]MDI6099097.1 murein biosynthesis integral membrane protein MurJ [Actinoplanes sandaracinus]